MDSCFWTALNNFSRKLERRITMQKVIGAFIFLAAAIASSGPMSVRAQDKPTTENKPPVVVHPTPLKIQIVFTEFEGDKKVKSMPYTSVFTADPGRGQDFAKLRIGSRVPLYTGK